VALGFALRSMSHLCMLAGPDWDIEADCRLSDSANHWSQLQTRQLQGLLAPTSAERVQFCVVLVL
jgi:hypothetical protein